MPAVFHRLMDEISFNISNSEPKDKLVVTSYKLAQQQIKHVEKNIPMHRNSLKVYMMTASFFSRFAC